MKFYEVVRHNRRLKSEQTPFYRGGKIGKISFFIAVAKFAKSPFYSGAKTVKIFYQRLHRITPDGRGGSNVKRALIRDRALS